MVTWQLTIDWADPSLMVRFWGPVLGYEVMPPPEGHASWNEWYLSVGVPADELDLDGGGSDRLHDPTGAGPSIWFQVVPEPKTGKNRFHLDVTTPDLAALIAAGATVLRPRDPEIRWTVLADPDGNEFCAFDADR